MRKLYFLLFALTANFLTAQTSTTVDFTAAEGYIQGALNVNSDWGGGSNNWFVSPAVGSERAETSAGYSWAKWGVPFTVSGSEITFEVHFKISVDIPASKLVSRFGFNNNVFNSFDEPDIANIQLSTLKEGGLFVRAQGNTPVTSGGSGLTDFQQDDLIIKVMLTLGADAASSTISAELTNATDNITSGIAVVQGISSSVFNAATSGGISGFIHAQDNIGNTRNFLVDKVVMIQGSTLNRDTYMLPSFTLSQNPVKDIVQLTGVASGSEISIYSLTGAKTSNHVYDGSPLNLSHLNPGVYFIEVSGFAAKKLLKK